MLLLFATEILIALFAHDQIIRPYGGDFLVVIFLYCLIKSFSPAPVIPVAVAVLLFSYLIETSQYFNLAHHMDLDQSKITLLIMGNHFAWIDILAYTSGILTVLWLEKYNYRSILFLLFEKN
jgi:hypothetical protein